MLDFLVFTEEDEKEDDKIEAYKSTILQSFPSPSMYEKLYMNQDQESSGFIEAITQDYEDIRDIIDVINESFKAGELDLIHG